MWKAYLCVFIGGGAGSMLRFALSRIPQVGYWPLGTWIANMTGCLLIGLLIGRFSGQDDTDQLIRWSLITGFCGGYTTFSAFSAESMTLITQGHWGTALAYTLGSVLIGIAAVWAGLWIAGEIF